MHSIDLLEYGSAVGRFESPELDALIELAGDRLSFSRRPAGQTEIRATSHVGVMVSGDFVVRVRPKVPLDNLFHLLGVAAPRWQVDQRPAAYGTDDEDASTALVRLFAREVEQLTARGLLNGYVAQEDRLLAVRGRVDLGAAMRRPWERSPVPCRFDEFVPDVFVNRALLAALTAARRVPLLPPEVRGDLHLLMSRFEGVAAVPIDPAAIERWRPNRNDRHYAAALRLAGVVLEGQDLKDRSGSAVAASFTVDMNKLFEEFVGRELRRRMPPGYQLAEQYSTKLDVIGRLSMRPDLVVHPTGRPKQPLVVADVKYKLTESLGVISDHYQLLAYATVFGLREGVLIYCQRPEGEQMLDEVPPARYLDIVGGQVRNHVFRIDVSGDRASIATRLDELAAFILDRVSSDDTMRLEAAGG